MGLTMGKRPPTVHSLPPAVASGRESMDAFARRQAAAAEDKVRTRFIRILGELDGVPAGLLSLALAGKRDLGELFPAVPWNRMVVCRLPEGKGEWKMHLERFFDGGDPMDSPFGDAIRESGVDDPFVIYRVAGLPENLSVWVAYRAMFDIRISRGILITQADGVHFWTCPARVWARWMRKQQEAD